MIYNCICNILMVDYVDGGCFEWYNEDVKNNLDSVESKRGEKV